MISAARIVANTTAVARVSDLLPSISHRNP
jgi:hypothetical protein